MTILFARHALLDDGWHDDVSIEIDSDGIISQVETDTVAGNADRIGIIIPGMPNLHSHAFQRIMAGRTEFSTSPDDSFWTWRQLMYQTANALTSDDVGVITKQLYIEMLKAGYTSVAEFHYLHKDGENEDVAGLSLAEAILGASAVAGIGMTLLPVVYQRAGFSETELRREQKRFHLESDEFLDLYKHLFDKHSNSSLSRLGLALHSLRAVDIGMIGQCLSGVRAIDPHAPVHIHIAEQQQEVDDCVSAHGKRPVDLLLDSFEIDDTWCLVHATHMSERERGRMAESGAIAGLCPATEANLGDGIFPLGDFLKKGGQYGVGSDSQVSVSPCEELKTLEYSNRLKEQRRLIASSSTFPNCGNALWIAAAEGGAKAMGQNVGCLKRGRRADLLVLDEKDLSVFGHSTASVLDGLIFNGPRNAIRDVMVGGKWVVRDGRHDQEEEAEEAYRRVVEERSK